jgi:asparagine synthase (glutamine-hydrolysing)
VPTASPTASASSGPWSSASPTAGPDAVGVREARVGDTVVQLGHRRLSIIDLSTEADQPFVKDGLWLSYNGELYNFLELRAELEAQGVRFVTRSDTEVVLEALRRWGTDALRRFRGMFAFALVDERAGTLLLARDPLGIKPLYVMPRGAGVVFASELKALVVAAGRELRVNARALVASTLFYFVPEEITALDGVVQLPAGSWMRWERGGSTGPHRYWDPIEEAHRAAEQPEQDLGEVLERSVRAHLVADVPVASFLSGGLDSSLITAMAARRDPSIEAYTITFRPEDQRLEAMPDDAVYARKMAAHLGITLHEIEISPDVVDMLPRIVEMLDEPIGDPAAINTVLMCRAARDAGVKVLLSGMGRGRALRRIPQAPRLPARRPLTGDRAPDAADPRRGPVGRPTPGRRRRRGLRYSRWAKRFLTLRRAARGGAFRRSYTLYDRDELVDLLDPRLAGTSTAVFDGHRALYQSGGLDDHVQPDVPRRLPPLHAGAQPHRTPTGRAWTPPPRCGCRSSTRSSSCRVRHPWQSQDPRPGPRRYRYARWRRSGCRADVIDRPRRPRGAAAGWGDERPRPAARRRPARRRVVAQACCGPEPLRQMVADQRSGRRDVSKQLWQLLSMELWYRGRPHAGVGAA